MDVPLHEYGEFGLIPAGFVLWTFDGPDDLVCADVRTAEELIAAGHLAPAASRMDPSDVCHQFNNVNGGEAWLTVPGSMGPALSSGVEDDGPYLYFTDGD